MKFLPILSTISGLIEHMRLAEGVQDLRILRIDGEIVRGIFPRKCPNRFKNEIAFGIARGSHDAVISCREDECAGGGITLDVEDDVIFELDRRNAHECLKAIRGHEEIADGSCVENVLVSWIACERENLRWLVWEHFPCFPLVERAVDAKLEPAVDGIRIRRVHYHGVKISGACRISITHFRPCFSCIRGCQESQIASFTWVAATHEDVWIGRMQRESHEVIAAVSYECQFFVIREDEETVMRCDVDAAAVPPIDGKTVHVGVGERDSWSGTAATHKEQDGDADGVLRKITH